MPRWFPLTFGCRDTLTVRRESIPFGLAHPMRVLYASDLHLGHPWTSVVPAQLLRVMRDAQPDIILLGGDLADSPSALAQLRDLVRALTEMAPVYAVPGNHDARAGLAGVRSAVVSAGGFWLPDRPVIDGLRMEAAVEPVPHNEPRLLCAHYPDDFPAAAAAGYRLVLAGHLHGSQCVFGAWNDKLYPAVWIHRWHGLRFQLGSSTMLVSRGVADTFPFRFNCPREVLLCALT